MNIVKISDLSGYHNVGFRVHETLSIRASVSIKSSIKGTYRKTAFFMDLRDDSGDIAAISTLTQKFFALMEENKIYTITGFRLQNSDADYTSIPHPKMICLDNSTQVAFYGNAPHVDWPLTPLNKVDLHRRKQYCVNIVGVCTKVGATAMYGTKLMRKLTLVDEEGGAATLAVWAKETVMFDNLDLNTQPVVFAKDARIEDVGLTPTRYLKLLDPSDPIACRVKTAFVARQPTAI